MIILITGINLILKQFIALELVVLGFYHFLIAKVIEFLQQLDYFEAQLHQT